MQSKIFFYGGAGGVTGSNFLLQSGEAKFLVDCGLFQGAHVCEEGNWNPFLYDPASISHLVITHAHIDHIGRIPVLVKHGFKGKIISTEATRALAEPLLQDAIELIAHDAKRCGKEPLYGERDIADALKLWNGIGYHQKVELPGGFSLELLDAGHILGSAMVLLRRGSAGQARSIVFTGDLGGGNSPLLSPVEKLSGVDYLVMESVYGDRVRKEDKNRRELLENIVEDTIARGGTLLIPAFSTERTQDLLYEVRTLMVERRVPSVPVFIDSPLAQKITEAYMRYPQYFSEPMQARIAAGERIFSFPELRFIETVQESQKIESVAGPKIIIAGSGMSNGGRVLAHERGVIPDKNSTLLIVGYQTAGSMGRRLAEGAKEIQIHGEKIPVRAKVEAIYGYSAHMDGEELLEFANQSGADGSLKQVFCAMGEPASAGFLAQRIRDYLGVKATAPEAGSQAEIEL